MSEKGVHNIEFIKEQRSISSSPLFLTVFSPSVPVYLSTN
jgi:hypothetical protein